MLNSFDISVSGMVAQRARLDAIAGNIANVSTTRNEQGESVPYDPRFVVFVTQEANPAASGAAGVNVASVETAHLEPRWRYEPEHPDAVKDGPRKGWVAYPNIDLVTEMVDALQATRAYEANVGAIETTKDLAQQTLRILA